MRKKLLFLITIFFTNIIFSQNEFITTWQTTTNSETITIPTFLGETYLYDVDWGDSNTDNSITGNASHTYAVPGIYTVKITGLFPRIYFQNEGTRWKLQSVEQWGTNVWSSMAGAFYNCPVLTINANDAPDLSSVESLENMFRDCKKMNQDISNWNTSSIKSMRNMFRGASIFNQDISTWDVSGVTNMNRMFRDATNFNQDISTWDVANVTDMGNLFRDTSFNQNIGAWSISKVTTMSEMFSGAPMSVANYDNTLIGWADINAQITIPRGIVLNAGNAKFCLGEDARNTLKNNYNWTITDQGKDAACLTGFITKWNTNNTSFGSSNNNQITIPTNGGGYNYTVDWGDGTRDEGVTGTITHTYASAGEYTVLINGDFPRIEFNNSGDRQKLLSIDQWGDTKWNNMRNAFRGCLNIEINASDSPDLSLVTDMSNMFDFAINFNADLSNWDISNVIAMTNMLTNTAFSIENYDKLLISWATQNVQPNIVFSVPTTKYCVGKSGKLILEASPNNWIISDDGFDASCTQPFITTWQTTAANEDIHISTHSGETYNYTIDWGDGTSNSNVTGDITHSYPNAGMHTVTITENFPRIYFRTSETRSKLYSVKEWGTTIWTSMESAFYACNNVNFSAIDAPDLSNVTSMGRMFYNATNFNADISNWNVANVVDMKYMFYGAVNFNSDISNWNVSRVESTQEMFNQATNFNADLSGWNVSNVTRMNYMFRRATSFNQDLSSWNVSRVEQMTYMFREATSFNQNLSNWDLSSVTSMAGMLEESAVSMANYDAILIGWAEDSSGVANDGIDDIPNNVSFTASSSYCAATVARNTLAKSIEDGGYNWNINDDGNACASIPFITTWQTSAANEEIHISVAKGEVYDYTIDWGDGTIETNITGDIKHNYINTGIHTVKISGQFPRIFFTNSDTKSNLLSVEQWGDTVWTSMERAFMGCNNLTTINIATSPDLSEVISMNYMFDGATNFNSDLSNWNISKVTSMRNMFKSAKTFNQNISNWNTSNVTNMRSMFDSAENFNSDISNWNVSNVTDMKYMFYNASNFNSNISNWNVSSVKDMQHMFRLATNFKSDISSWNVANVIDMEFMFRDATNFNSDLSNWNVSKVVDMQYMFYDAASFNSDISSWNVSSVTDMKHMFRNAISFNSDISSWVVANVINMEYMFYGASSFNSDLSNWDVSKVRYMKLMFHYATSFNSNISSWNVALVGSFQEMFNGATNFNQNLSNWDLSSATSMSNMLTGTALSMANYDAILIGWATDSSGVNNDGIDDIPSNIYFDVNSTYCNSEAARTTLASAPYSWSITDKGNGCASIPFITTWQTSTANEEIHISTAAGTTYDYAIDWGDGTNNTNVVGNIRHTYTSSGVYTVTITGKFPRVYFKESVTKDKLISIEQWGITIWEDMTEAFDGCVNLTMNALDTPNLSTVTSTGYMFNNCTNLSGNLSNWDVSNVENMEFMFANTTSFNSDISNWDVSNAIILGRMFNGATAFNQDLSNWNVSKANFMNYMFNGAAVFNHSLADWDISSVLSMEDMLNGTALSTSNYDSTLIGWATLDIGETKIPTNVHFDANNSSYCDGEAIRNLLTLSIADGGYNWSITDAGKECNILLSPKVYLQGAFTSPFSGEETLMRDDLRVLGHLPITSPYSDELKTESSVFNVAGVDAIVDWVWVELRDKEDSTNILSSSSALLQRDGDIVDVDGISPITINVNKDDYYIAISHRNHLKILTKSTYSLSNDNTEINLFNNSANILGDANAVIDMANSIYAIPSGDSDSNGQIQITDVRAIIQMLGTSGYHNTDMDMNGQIQNSDINNIVNINVGKGQQF